MHRTTATAGRRQMTEQIRHLLQQTASDDAVDLLCHEASDGELSTILQDLMQQERPPAASNFRFGRPVAAAAPCPVARDLHAAWIATPLGALLALADSKALHYLKFTHQKLSHEQFQHLQKAVGARIRFGHRPPLDSIEQELNAYFAGKSAVFRTPLALHAPSFTRAAWETLCHIPAGKTFSYAQQARHMQNPRATQAVGYANSRNPVIIAIPCHRVIGSNGALTGYNGGIWRKKWLLAHEKRHFQS